MPKRKKLALPSRQPRRGEGRADHEFAVVADYYQRAFLLFHAQLERQGYDSTVPHPVRRRYWQLLPEGQYSSLESRPLMLGYMRAVEQELASVIGRHSLGYWLHVYRRLSPGPIGADRRPVTIAETRGTLEAAIQKYATLEPCSGVGLSNEIAPSRVLNGLLMGPEFERERRWIQEQSQLVLTEFTPTELQEVYDAERLAFELWRGSAVLRSVGKGGGLLVSATNPWVIDVRTRELDTLVKRYDARLETWDPRLLSALGVVSDLETGHDSAVVLFPAYNVCGAAADECSFVFRRFLAVSFPANWVPNFLWVPYVLSAFRDAHLPFAEAFRANHGVSLDAALFVIWALGRSLFETWMTTHPGKLVHYLQRAYVGPYLRDEVYADVRSHAGHASGLLGPDSSGMESADLEAALRFWTLDESHRADIDLGQAGPHAVFLPFGRDRMFIDYAWILSRLYRLFVGVTIPNQNFKGDALERLVRGPRSLLPVGPCKSRSGECRQIDAAFAVGDRLAIVECRAAGWSIGSSRGNPDAIRHRNRILDAALSDVDAKAAWLARNPVGTNYGIGQFRDIIPIVVTPFVEYIPSLQSHYWLSDKLPRILSPGEVRTALEENTLGSVVSNTIPIVRS